MPDRANLPPFLVDGRTDGDQQAVFEVFFEKHLKRLNGRSGVLKLALLN
jgi:hypothetical protein